MVGPVADPHEGDESVGDKTCLAVALIHVHVVGVYRFFDIGAAPNVMYPQLSKRQYLKLKQTSKVVKVANETKFGISWKNKDISVSFESIQGRLDFVLLENVPFDLFFKCSMFEILGRVLDFM